MTNIASFYLKRGKFANECLPYYLVSAHFEATCFVGNKPTRKDIRECLLSLVAYVHYFPALRRDTLPIAFRL